MLHILNQAPSSEAAQQMLLTVAKNDSILLIEDAVQALLDVDWQGWSIREDSVDIFVLSEDAISRGLSGAANQQDVTFVDMEGFVLLTEQHANILTWY